LLTNIHITGKAHIVSMGDLQDPTDGGTLVPYFRPYFLGIFPAPNNILADFHPEVPGLVMSNIAIEHGY